MGSAHPFDLIKVRLQIKDTHSSGHSVLAVAREIYNASGIGGFFVGLGAALLRQFVYKGVSFATYDLASAQIPSRIVAAIVAGVVGALCGCPAEVALVRAQAQSDLSLSSGVFKSLARIVFNEGPQSLFVGLLPNCVRAAVVTLGQLATYDFLREEFAEEFGPSFALDVFAAVCAGFTSAVFSNPIDVIKTRLQAQGLKSPRYRGPAHCLLCILKDEGATTLFSGVGATSIRMVPYVSIMMVTNSTLKQIV